jgi:hypothetical protein
VVGKTLAPKPGQRPVRPAKGSSTGPSTSLVKDQHPETAADDNTAAPPPNLPRPGQRPQRAGKRPPAKRSSRAKKRR